MDQHHSMLCKGCWQNLHPPVMLRGPLSIPYRMFGLRPSRMNPNTCTFCELAFTKIMKARNITIDATVLFADLRGYTSASQSLPASEMNATLDAFYDESAEAIWQHDGLLNKTIGDAVMAVFRRPVSSLRAVLDAQGLLASPPNGARPLFLKAGVHSGPCIAVTLNDRLDYFGSTVNAAARIVGLSNGEDVVLSGAVRSDPEVLELLSGAGLAIEPVEADLKGFDEERFELWRVRRG
jgi:class 3 adenylate cyclase